MNNILFIGGIGFQEVLLIALVVLLFFFVLLNIVLVFFLVGIDFCSLYSFKVQNLHFE